MKKVSVILTTYNAANTLRPTLRSILEQEGAGTEYELDLIAVDDCSDDDSMDILREHGLDPLQTPARSGGPNLGRNMGLARSDADGILIADHDDLWEPDRIRSMLPHLDQVPVLSCGYHLQDQALGHSRVRVQEDRDGSGYRDFVEDETFRAKLSKRRDGQNTYLGSIMYRGELANIRFEETHGMVDFDWILRMFHGRSSREVCRPLYTRVVQPGNLSFDPDYRTRDFHYTLDTMQTYAKEYPEEVRIGRARAHGTLARYHYVTGNMPEARRHFRQDQRSWKTLAYYMTTYAGSRWVKHRFNVFG